MNKQALSVNLYMVIVILTGSAVPAAYPIELRVADSSPNGDFIADIFKRAVK